LRVRRYGERWAAQSLKRCFFAGGRCAEAASSGIRLKADAHGDARAPVPPVMVVRKEEQGNDERRRREDGIENAGPAALPNPGEAAVAGSVMIAY